MKLIFGKIVVEGKEKNTWKILHSSNDKHRNLVLIEGTLEEIAQALQTIKRRKQI